MRIIPLHFVPIAMLTITSFKLAALKLTSPTRTLLEQHYADLKEKPFFPGLVTCKFPSTLQIRS